MPATPKRKPLSKRRRPSSPGGDGATGEVAGPQPNDEELSEKECIQSKDITGLKYFDMLLPLLQPLHDDQCQRDKANNRDLHFDQYCMLVLLYLFNPTVTSLRAIQQASELEKVQKKLDCSRASLLKATTGSGAVKWRLHTHFEVDRYIPSRIDVTPDQGGRGRPSRRRT